MRLYIQKECITFLRIHLVVCDTAEAVEIMIEMSSFRARSEITNPNSARIRGLSRNSIKILCDIWVCSCGVICVDTRER